MYVYITDNLTTRLNKHIMFISKTQISKLIMFIHVLQTISLLEQEKSTLMEKNNNLNMELASSNVEYERLKRESLARQEQDRNNVNGLQCELKNFRSQFEQTWYVLYKFNFGRGFNLHVYYYIVFYKLWYSFP